MLRTGPVALGWADTLAFGLLLTVAVSTPTLGRGVRGAGDDRFRMETITGRNRFGFAAAEGARLPDSALATIPRSRRELER